MKVEKHTGKEERTILTGMIVDRTVLSKVAAKWGSKMFNTKWANIVGGWCVQYFKQYGKAPLAHIDSLFEAWSQEERDEEVIDLIERFLRSLSDDYESQQKEINSAYVIDVAGRYFKRVQLQHLAAQIEGDIASSQVEDAEQRVLEFNSIEMGGGEGADVFHDIEVINRAFDESAEVMLRYPGDLGVFFGDAFSRDSFVAFQAPEKRGKTWWLLDVAYRAMEAGRKVAFFSVGDMSEPQLVRRLLVRTARHPVKPRTVKIPISLIVDDSERRKTVPKVRHRIKKFKTGLTKRLAVRSIKRMRAKLGTKEKLFKVSTHPNSTLSVHGIEGILRSWERAGWTPDFIVIDYADILAMPDGGTEPRNQTNETWKRLRALSQKTHTCVVTATQANAASYKVDSMGMDNFSEDKRKFAHVTGTVGINQTPAEKRDGIMRLNWIVLRENEFDTTQHVYCAGCLSIGAPAMRSSF